MRVDTAWQMDFAKAISFATFCGDRTGYRWPPIDDDMTMIARLFYTILQSKRMWCTIEESADGNQGSRLSKPSWIPEACDLSSCLVTSPRTAIKTIHARRAKEECHIDLRIPASTGYVHNRKLLPTMRTANSFPSTWGEDLMETA